MARGRRWRQRGQRRGQRREGRRQVCEKLRPVAHKPVRARPHGLTHDDAAVADESVGGGARLGTEERRMGGAV